MQSAARPSTAIFVSDQHADSIAYSQIPYAAEQGNFQRRIKGRFFPPASRLSLTESDFRPRSSSTSAREGLTADECPRSVCTTLSQDWRRVHQSWLRGQRSLHTLSSRTSKGSRSRRRRTS